MAVIGLISIVAVAFLVAYRRGKVITVLVCTVSSLITHVAIRSVIMPAGVRVITIMMIVGSWGTFG